MKAYKYFGIAVAVAISISTSAQNSSDPVDEYLISGERVINTTTLTPQIFGYGGVTPLKLHIADDKITEVELLGNYESPAYLSMVVAEGLLKKWNGVEVSRVADLEVDCVSGATCSSMAIIQNVKVAAQYAIEHKK